MNLIYTICDSKYKDIFMLWYESITKYNNTDLLVICDDSFNNKIELPNLKKLVLSDFDYKYTAKYKIVDWSELNNYKNILFLDADILCKSELGDIFDMINDHPDMVHSVKEHSNLDCRNYFYRFGEEKIDASIDAYNAGTFGFNIKNIDTIHRFNEFIKKNKKDAYCDQPLFNMFFAVNGLITANLSNYVYLDGHDINTKPVDQYKLIHFFGNYGDKKNKLDRMNKFL